MSRIVFISLTLNHSVEHFTWIALWLVKLFLSIIVVYVMFDNEWLEPVVQTMWYTEQPLHGDRASPYQYMRYLIPGADAKCRAHYIRLNYKVSMLSQTNVTKLDLQSVQCLIIDHKLKCFRPWHQSIRTSVLHDSLAALQNKLHSNLYMTLFQIKHNTIKHKMHGFL